MPRSFGLRAALALLVLIATAPAFLVVLWSSIAEQDARVEGAEATMRSTVNLVAAQQERQIDGTRQMLAAIASAPPVYQDDLQACATYLRKIQVQYPATFGTFGVLDARGGLTCRAPPPPTPVDSSDRLFFRTAVSTGRFSVGEYTTSRVSGRPVLTFGLPIYRDEDQRDLRGVAYLAMDVSRTDELLRKLALVPELTLLVADARGTVIAGAGARAVKVGTPLPDRFLRRAVAQGEARFQHAHGDDGGNWLFAVQPVGKPEEGRLYLAAMMSSADLLAPAEQRLKQQLAALGLITLLGAALAWFFGDRVLVRPVRQVLDRVEAMRREELPLNAAPAPGGLLELRRLEDRILQVARTLAERAVQRDEATAEVAGQKDLLGSVLESMAEGVLVVGRGGRFIHVNAAAHRIVPGIAELNRHKEPLHEPLEIYEMDSGLPVEPERMPALRALAGEPVDGFRYRIGPSLSGGPDKIIHGHARTLTSPEGEPYGAVLVFSDVTAAWRAQEELKESERRYRTLFESNPHPMWVYDVETLRFLTVNDAAVAHYGYSREQFLAMTIKDIRPPEDVEPLLNSLDGGDPATASVWRHQLADGRIIHVEVSSHSLDYAGRRARMVLVHDMTERLLARQALVQAKETLEARVIERTRELALANQELESFSYSVSHDLRAPLQVIDGFGRALQAKHSQALDPQALHYLNRIRENTRQMGELIDDLLSLARVTRSELRVEQVDLAPRAAQVVERLRQRWPERQVTVEIDGAIHVVGDTRLLGIALENLIENAWKFTGRVGNARIRIGQRQGPGGEPVVYVADNGAGFDMAYAAKLFSAFQRLHSASEFEGTGIGLATVHRIIMRHGGRVWAEASPGEGATFQFTLKPGVQDEKHQDPPR